MASCHHCLRQSIRASIATRHTFGPSKLSCRAARTSSPATTATIRSYATQTDDGIYSSPPGVASHDKLKQGRLDSKRPSTYRKSRQLTLDDIWRNPGGEAAAAHANGSVGANGGAGESETISDAQLSSQLLSAIRARSPEHVLAALQLVHKHGRHGLLDSSEKLVAVLEALAPDRSDVANGHATSSPMAAYRKRMAFFRIFLADGLRKSPLEGGLKPDREVFFLLLEHARISADAELATQTWAQMVDAGVQPDVFCYNTLLAATCTQPADFDDPLKSPLRKRPELGDSPRRRRRASLGAGQSGSDARAKSMELAAQKSRQALQIYRDMLAKGIEPTAMTVECLVLAMAANANLDGVRVLLRQTWGVALPELDYESLAQDGVLDEYEEEGIYDSQSDGAGSAIDGVGSSVPEPKVDRDSPLHPTAMTCRVLAIGLGANNQARAAAKLLRTFCAQYDLPADSVAAAWTELLKWAHLDAGPAQAGKSGAISAGRAGGSSGGGATVSARGFAPPDVVAQLFKQATTPQPHGAGCTPTAGMYAWLIRSYIARSHLTLASDAILAMIDAAETELDRLAGSGPGARTGPRSAGGSHGESQAACIADLVARTVVVAESTLLSVGKQMRRRIRQCEARVDRANASGGSDAIRIATAQRDTRTRALDVLERAVEQKLTHLEDKAQALSPSAVAPTARARQSGGEVGRDAAPGGGRTGSGGRDRPSAA